jgi:folate-binding protein YgfZ
VDAADRSARGRLWVRGDDRARFLHNLTTNDIKALKPGAGCEAFVTSPQGRTLALVTVHALGDALLVRTDPGVLATLMPHFLKYGALDSVEFEDSSARTDEVHLTGEGAAGLLSERSPGAVPADDLDIVQAEAGGRAVWVIAESPLGTPGWTLIGEELRRSIPEGSWLTEAEMEARRIEAGTPEFGKDFTEANLPQEADRNARAISFVKGCYLGQETVARLDALGHVNKILRRLIFETADPVPGGAVLESGGKAVGTATSTAYSPRVQTVVGLGMVRTSHAQSGTELECTVSGRQVAVRVA